MRNTVEYQDEKSGKLSWMRLEISSCFYEVPFHGALDIHIMLQVQ